MNWQPTCELRWVEQTVEIPVGNECVRVVQEKVLQQKWVQKHQEGEMYEWRDVPVEQEATSPQPPEPSPASADPQGQASPTVLASFL